MLGSSETDLMSQRSQRWSVTVITLRPSLSTCSLCGLVCRVVITSAGLVEALGNLWSRGATPRVTCMYSMPLVRPLRLAERRVGQECVSQCETRRYEMHCTKK